MRNLDPVIGRAAATPVATRPGSSTAGRRIEGNAYRTSQGTIIGDCRERSHIRPGVLIRGVARQRGSIGCGLSEAPRRGGVVTISRRKIPHHALSDKPPIECGLVCWRISGHRSGSSLIRHGDNLTRRAEGRVGARFDRIVAAHDARRPTPALIRGQTRFHQVSFQVGGVAVGGSLARPVRESPARLYLNVLRHRIARLLPAPERDTARRPRGLVAEQMHPASPRREIEQSRDLRPRYRACVLSPSWLIRPSQRGQPRRRLPTSKYMFDPST